MDILKYLNENLIIADGAFGTYYSAKYNTDEIPENANIDYPERVIEIHKEYIEAGATLLRTNSFAAYDEYTGSGQAVEIVRKSVELAKAAVSQTTEKKILIAGDIGPAPFDMAGKNHELYSKMADVLLKEGADILIFETFPDMDEISQAVKLIKKNHPDAVIFANFAVNQYGTSTNGRNASRLLETALSMEEISGAGFNCNMGPAHMAALYEKLKVKTDKLLLAFPNAGYPKRVRDRIIYSDNQQYFAEKMKSLAIEGIDILGGCCGTKPGYIKELTELKLKKSASRPKSIEKEAVKTKPIDKSFFSEKKGKLIAVELIPPLNVNDESIIKSAHYLKEHGVDCLTFPDSPSGRTRVDSVLMAKKIKELTGLKVVPHLACRDKNAIAMRSQIMGAYINDISNFLIITGDPVPVSERGQIKNVFNFDSTGLMAIADDMNHEFFESAPMTYGGAINQGRRNIQPEIERVKKKLSRGASFFFTQPVFTAEDADRIRLIKEETGARILCGIMPLISRKNALFMKNEISGINISDEIINQFPENATKAEGEAVGVSIAKNSILMTEDFADGYYFSFPFNRVYLLEQIQKA